MIRGNLLFIPVGESYAYVEPIYLQADNARFPQLKAVIVVNGDTIAFEDTFADAVQVALGTQAPRGLTFTGGGAEATPQPAAPRPAVEDDDRPPLVIEGTAAELAAQAQEVFEEAQERLRAGDFAGYGDAVERLGAILERLASSTE